MADDVAFVEVNFALRIQSSVVHGVIITFTQEERLFLLLVFIFFTFIAVGIDDLLYGTYPVHNGDLLIFNLVNYYVSDFYCWSFYEY